MPPASPYDDLIMEHIKNARNFAVPDAPAQTATGTNLLCGDELTLYLVLADERVRQLAFQCTCCGISMASASMMTELLGGSDVATARTLAQAFGARLLARDANPLPGATPEQRALIDTVQRFPSRNRCAALPWATLEGALNQRSETVIQP